MARSPSLRDDPSSRLRLLGELLLVVAIAVLLATLGVALRADEARAGDRLLLVASLSALALTCAGAVVTCCLAPRARVEDERDTAMRGLEVSFAHAPVGLVFHDREGHHLRGNAALAQVGGVPPEHLTGKTVREVAPAYAAEVERCLAKVFDTGQPVREVEVTGPMAAYPGEVRHLSLNYFPVLRAGGEVLCAAGFILDITERKRAEAELRASYARLRRLWGSNILGVLYANGDGEVVDANDAALRMVGYSREELCAGAARFRALTPTEHAPHDAQGLAEARERGACTPYEKVYVRKDGGQVHVLIGYATLDPPGPELIVFVVDQTERAHLLERERFARAEAERASRVKDTFVATASHELRTPLSAVLGWAQMLRRPGTTPAQVERGLGIIERNARQLAELVSDLLDIGRITSGKVRLDIGRVCVGEAVDLAVEGLRGAAEAKGVALEVAPPPAGRVPVLGDTTRLVQVVSNLLSNAIKFTAPGGRVDVAFGQHDGRAWLRVADTGEGITPELLPHLFEQFRQADSPTTRRHGGLGIGLAIVKHIVELHGGAVRAESAGVGQGAAFEVELPLTDVAPTADLPAEPSVAPPSIAGVRVLVVEDDADARDLARRVLEERGAVVSVAASAPEGLAAIERAAPDVLVSDIGLPGMDGYELMRRLRAHSDRSIHALPAAALTAFARPEDREHALEAGFSLHVAKPFEPSRLVAAVARLAATAPAQGG